MLKPPAKKRKLRPISFRVSKALNSLKYILGLARHFPAEAEGISTTATIGNEGLTHRQKTILEALDLFRYLRYDEERLLYRIERSILKYGLDKLDAPVPKVWEDFLRAVDPLKEELDWGRVTWLWNEIWGFEWTEVEMMRVWDREEGDEGWWDSVSLYH